MGQRLLVAVLGNRNAGKSTTWNYLFDPTGATTIRTGKHPRPLYLNKAQWVEVFVVSGSAEEREIDIDVVIPDPLPRIVLCSTQYRSSVTTTFDYFFARDFEVFVQWLNPGYNDAGTYPDTLGLRDHLLNKGATLQMRDGKAPLPPRLTDLRQCILGWATHRDLVKTEFP